MKETATATVMHRMGQEQARVAGKYYGVPFSGRVLRSRQVTVAPYPEELSIALDRPVKRPGGGEEGGVILICSDDVDNGKHSIARTMPLSVAAEVLADLGKTKRPPHAVTLQRWCRTGVLQAHKSPEPGNPWRVTRQALEEFEPPTPHGRRGAWRRWESKAPGREAGSLAEGG